MICPNCQHKFSIREISSAIPCYCMKTVKRKCGKCGEGIRIRLIDDLISRGGLLIILVWGTHVKNILYLPMGIVFYVVYNYYFSKIKMCRLSSEEK